MGRKAVGPVCCVMHVKEPRTLIVKEKGLAPVFLDLRLEHPAGWICVLQIFCIIIIIIIIIIKNPDCPLIIHWQTISEMLYKDCLNIKFVFTDWKDFNYFLINDRT